MNQKMLGIYADIINNLFGFAVIATPPKSKLLSRSPLIFLSVAKAYKCTYFKKNQASCFNDSYWLIKRKAL
jgi:hypothetical protein